MAQILIFIYALIIVLSLRLVVSSKTTLPCVSKDDCPLGLPPLSVTCIKKICLYYVEGF
ncbi:putative Late nodulin [Medicago truncatula]|uniref:Putative Late nodulin n=1 Tax=Medicago truncatula TaxID=3880 RepID=A0A396JHW9_MEDTR|nr:putative Late nodulin [Medicago truncatula]